MSTRIPSSLKWLVTKYQSTENELLDIQDKLAKLRANELELLELKSSLSNVLAKHEIPIDSSEIPPVRKNIKHTNLKYGLVTKKIYEGLKILDAEQGVTLTHIVDFIEHELCLDLKSRTDKSTFRRYVASRMKALARKNKITRIQVGISRAVDPMYKLSSHN